MPQVERTCNSLLNFLQIILFVRFYTCDTGIIPIALNMLIMNTDNLNCFPNMLRRNLNFYRSFVFLSCCPPVMYGIVVVLFNYLDINNLDAIVQYNFHHMKILFHAQKCILSLSFKGILSKVTNVSLIIAELCKSLSQTIRLHILFNVLFDWYNFICRNSYFYLWIMAINMSLGQQA